MSVAIEFSWDSRGLDFFRGKNAEKALTRAIRLAGNQAIRALRKEAIRFALGKKALHREDVEADQRVEKPNARTDLGGLVWKLVVEGKPVPVFKFPHVDTRRLRSGNGVLVRFGPGRAVRLTGAFVTAMGSGHIGVFRRTGQARLPIDELFSARLPKAYGEEVTNRYGGKALEKMQTAFTRGLEREIAKLRRRGMI